MPFKWETENTFYVAINDQGYLFLESLLALSLTAAISIFYISLIISMLSQVHVEKSNVELSRALYDLSRLDTTDNWQRRSGSFIISGYRNEEGVFVYESLSGNSLKIELPENNQEISDE